MFEDRADAGRQLAAALADHASPDVVVLGLPRGGVPVAWHVARALGAPLDVILVRKLGVPYQPELAMGAVGEGGARVLNNHVVARCRITQEELARVEAREGEELARRVERFRGGRPPVDLEGCTAVIVDDGIATGATAKAACRVARARGARRVVLAVPVAPPHAVRSLRKVADEVVCLSSPHWFSAVGEAYRSFDQVSDSEVAVLLGQEPPRPRTPTSPTAAQSSANPAREVRVDAGPVELEGTLAAPRGTGTVVLFAHGSGSSRHSPRNRYVAEQLQRAGLGTLLFDLLTPEEEHRRDLVFDIDLLAGRLLAATTWVRRTVDPEPRIGYFGASTGAAAALVAAADPRARVMAVVSRGGRPDLAGPHLTEVTAPTLLVVGGDDDVVLGLNRRARGEMRAAESRLVVVPGAGHLFEEPGTLETVARLARGWFLEHLVTSPAEVPEGHLT